MPPLQVIDGQTIRFATMTLPGIEAVNYTVTCIRLPLVRGLPHSDSGAVLSPVNALSLALALRGETGLPGDDRGSNLSHAIWLWAIVAAVIGVHALSADHNLRACLPVMSACLSCIASLRESDVAGQARFTSASCS